MLLLKSFGILVKHARVVWSYDGCWDDLSKSFGILIRVSGEGVSLKSNGAEPSPHVKPVGTGEILVRSVQDGGSVGKAVAIRNASLRRLLNSRQTGVVWDAVGGPGGASP
jgi:hypothetical protein